jgi:hypothetical protein
MLSSKKTKPFSFGADAEEKPGLEKVFEIIVKKSIRTQKRLANALQKTSESLSVTGKKFALIIFCFIGIAASIYAFAENIFYKKKLTHLLVSPISISKDVFENDNRTSDILPETELIKIENFQKYIDSLSKSVSGQKVKDSILKFRPLLMDSINQLEKLYQLQEKNKK